MKKPGIKVSINPKTKKALVDYVLAVMASAVTMGIALLSNLRPEYAVLIGAITAPAAKWASKYSKDYGVGTK